MSCTVRCWIRYMVVPSGESASKPKVPFRSIWSRVERSAVRSRTKCVSGCRPMLWRTKVLPSRNRPLPGPSAVSVGTPNDPGIVCDIAVAASVSGVARTSVDVPALTATKRTEWSAFSRPSPPCTAYGPGYAAEAPGTTTSAPRTTRQRPSRRNIIPPSTLTGVLRRPGRKRSLRKDDPPQQEHDRDREAQAEREPDPGEARARSRGDPPAREVDVQPGASAPPVHRELLPVQGEHD